MHRMEYILTNGAHILDLDATVDESGLINNSTIHVYVRVRGGSSRLNSERKYALHFSPIRFFMVTFFL